MAIDYRKQIVASALKYVGTQEPKGDDQFITAYNKYANAKFGVDSTPWCAILSPSMPAWLVCPPRSFRTLPAAVG